MLVKKRILHVIANLGLGGAQSLLYHLWPALSGSDKYTFEICVLNSLGHFGEQLISEGAIVHCLGCKHKYDIGAVFGLRRIILDGFYRVVHVHLFPELIIAPLAALGLRHVRLVYTEHSVTNRRRGMGVAARMLDRLAYSRYARIIAINSSTYRNLVTWLPELGSRSVHIPNAVRVDLTGRLEDTGKTQLFRECGVTSENGIKLLLFAGRLVHEKGADVLLSSLALLKRSDYLCLIAGDGPERDKLEAMASSLGLMDRICFLGTRSDMLTLLRQVDFLVLPSRYEGLPLVILEAMAVGCPIVATKVDGTAEVLRHEASALLVPAEDTRALAEGIRRLLEDVELGRRLAARAREDVQAYSAQRAAQQLIALYDDVLST